MRPLYTDPMEWLKVWHDEAKAKSLPEPNAMTLATLSLKGTPSARIVLMKDCNSSGVTFFTNYESRKGQELAANPNVALIFFWPTLERQVRVEGPVTKVERHVSEQYFATRGRESQIGAWASQQSRHIASPEQLRQQFDTYAAEFADKPIPCPPHWGGYLVTPLAVEFWLGKPGRLHDRYVFQRASAQVPWQIAMLSP